MPETKKNIVWLASYPKSGNTWFRIFLSNLFSGSPRPVHINDLAETTISSNRNIIDRYLGMHSSELTADEIDDLRPQVFKRFADEKEGTAYVKTHEAWTLNSMGDPLFPEEITKGVIYIIRNPLDIAVSYSYHNNEPIDQTIVTVNNSHAKLCERKDRLNMQTQQILTSWSDHVSSWTDQSGLPVHTMRYEDMLNHPLKEFKKAVEFLDLKYGETEILQAIENSSFQRLTEMENRDGFKERGVHSAAFFRKGKSNEWETELSADQVAEIVKHHHVMMTRFGYLKTSEADHETATPDR